MDRYKVINQCSSWLIRLKAILAVIKEKEFILIRIREDDSNRKIACTFRTDGNGNRDLDIINQAKEQYASRLDSGYYRNR